MTKEILGLSSPHQTLLVCTSGTIDMMGKKRKIDNIITIDWHMPVSFNPPLYCISVGKNRFSLKLIRHSRCFSVNFMSHEYEKALVFCGVNSGVNVDKFKETKLTKVECIKIDTNYVKEAESVYECEVVDEIEAGDHVIFVGKIIHSQKHDDKRRILNTNKGFTTTMK